MKLKIFGMKVRKNRKIIPIAIFAMFIAMMWGCANRNSGQEDKAESNNEASSPTEQLFRPYEITDSARIVTYPSGLKLYTVRRGPGGFPREGMNLRVNYHGMLMDGTVFDSTFDRDEPFDITLGQTPIIKGFKEAVMHLRFGSQAVAIIPSELGYGKQGTPSKIPPNSALIFHIDVLGTF